MHAQIAQRRRRWSIVGKRDDADGLMHDGSAVRAAPHDPQMGDERARARRRRVDRIEAGGQELGQRRPLLCVEVGLAQGLEPEARGSVGAHGPQRSYLGLHYGLAR
jgi:hypothetical protein